MLYVGNIFNCSLWWHLKYNVISLPLAVLRTLSTVLISILTYQKWKWKKVYKKRLLSCCVYNWNCTNETARYMAHDGLESKRTVSFKFKSKINSVSCNSFRLISCSGLGCVGVWKRHVFFYGTRNVFAKRKIVCDWSSNEPNNWMRFHIELDGKLLIFCND